MLAGALALIGARTVAGAAPDPAAPNVLKRLSLEQLADLPVTSVAKRPVRLSATASAIEVITAEDIRRSGATSLPEALRLADNLDVAQVNSHDWAITARGFNTSLANKLLVLIDGRTVYTPLFSGVFWGRQDYLLADIERIEVISGPGGTLWGANAVNGVINIITRSAWDTQGGYVQGTAGTQPEALLGARYGGVFAPDVSFRAYAKSFVRGDESRVAGGSNHDAWHQGQGGFRIDGRASPLDSWTLQGDYYRGSQDVPTGGSADVSGANLLARWARSFSASSAATLQAYFDHTRLVDPIPPFLLDTTPLAPAGILSDDLDTFDVQFEHNLVARPGNHLVWGLGYRHTHDVVGNAPALAFYPAVLNQNLYSAFVQDELQLRDDVILTAGSKLEHNDYTGLELEPSVRLQWTRGGQMLWASVSRAVRTPSRVDRDISEPAANAPLVVLQGSADFSSETLLAHELGYRAQLGPALTISASAFYNRYDDVRSTMFTPTTVLPLVFANGLEGTTYGIELGLNCEVRDGWRLHGGYDLLRERIRIKPGQTDLNDAHNEVADPQQRVSLRSSLDLSATLQFDANLRWVDSRIINSGPTLAQVPGYGELDLRLGWRASDRVSLSLAGRNLLHARHVEYGFPSPTQAQIGRSLYATMVWRFRP
jgi:iron complex outermembrane receptor protein